MTLECVVCFIGLLILLPVWRASGTLYTRCNNLSGVVYKRDPLYSDTCESMTEAAIRCLQYSVCDLISINGTQCSFHTAKNQNVTCGNDGISSGNVSKATFRSCNCTLMEDFWIGVGSLYLYVTPGFYTCDQGQDVCKSLGGTMAEFYSIDELNNASTIITEDVFVGGKLVDNRYVWATTGQEIDDSLWAPGEPSHMAPCVQIWTRRNALDDTKQSSLQPILCQKMLQ